MRWPERLATKLTALGRQQRAFVAVATRRPMCFEAGVFRAVLVGLGGLLGSLARYWLAGTVQARADSGFPFGTLTVNVVGSVIVGLVVGLVMVLSLERGLLGAEMRLLLAVGFCGGFTTMSTFSYETVSLLRDGQVMLAVGNVGLTIVICLLAVGLGALIGRLL